MKTLAFPSFPALLAIAILLGVGSKSVAGLVWAETSKTMVVESGSASATYGFKNDGPGPVQISGVVSSCSCVSGSSSRNTLPPGESGEIQVSFSGKNHLGSEDKEIAIVSLSGTDKCVQLLKLHMDIKPDVVLDPPTLIWAKDEPAQAKVVRVKPSGPGKEPAFITKLESVKPGFKAAIDPSENATQFSVTPESTAKAQRSLIRITAEKKDKSRRDLIIYATVRP